MREKKYALKFHFGIEKVIKINKDDMRIIKRFSFNFNHKQIFHAIFFTIIESIIRNN